jgi:TPR repeat protein
MPVALASGLPVNAMRFSHFAIARLALVALPSSLLAFTAGCATSSFGGAAPGYDQQACLERALRRAPDPELVARASKAFKAECREGGAEACSALGVMNELGVGVPMDAAHAVALYARACAAGNSRGCANLGVARAEGIGGPRDVVAGARLLAPGCEHGDARACLHLGRLHLGGDGGSNDLALAAELFGRACAGEEPSACVALGDVRASAGNADAAAALYGEACGLGDVTGCRRLDVGSSQIVATSDLP